MIWNTGNSTHTFTGKILTVNSEFIGIYVVSRISSFWKMTNNNDDENNSNNS